MDVRQTNVPRLFEQLGLVGSELEIAAFTEKHRPLSAQLELHDAPFWTSAQAELLFESKALDAEWAEAADRLDAALR